jgi:hypothetical protein
MTFTKDLGRLRKVVFSVSKLEEGLHVFKVLLRRCAITDNVKFGVKFANNGKADIEELAANIFLVSLENPISTNVSSGSKRCTAKCKAVHTQIEFLLRLHRGTKPAQAVENIYALLLKKRRKMNVACFEDTWFLVKKLRPIPTDQATDYLSSRDELKIIVFDVQKLSVGLHVFEVAFTRGRVIDAAHFYFNTTTSLKVKGFSLKKKKVLMVNAESADVLCTPSCLAVHATLIKFRDVFLEAGDVENGVKLLADMLEESKNQMEDDCYELIESNLNYLLRFLKIA